MSNLVTPAFFSPALRDALLLAIQETGDVSAAAELVGSSRSELNAAMRLDPELAKDIASAGLHFKQSLVKVISKAATVGQDVKAAMWLLERIDPKFAPPKQRLDIRAGKLDNLSDAELLQQLQTGDEDVTDAEVE